MKNKEMVNQQVGAALLLLSSLSIDKPLDCALLVQSLHRVVFVIEKRNNTPDKAIRIELERHSSSPLWNHQRAIESRTFCRYFGTKIQDKMLWPS